MEWEDAMQYLGGTDLGNLRVSYHLNTHVPV